MSDNEFGVEDDIYNLLISRQGGSKHPERYIIGKPHPDRAKQFKPFAALQGYGELIDGVIEKASRSSDFSRLDEGC